MKKGKMQHGQTPQTSKITNQNQAAAEIDLVVTVKQSYSHRGQTPD
jgi:hypothetical protein